MPEPVYSWEKASPWNESRAQLTRLPRRVSQLTSYIAMEICSSKAGTTIERLYKESLHPKHFRATITTALEDHLNILVRWFCALVQCEYLTTVETATLFDKHADEFPHAVYTALQHDVRETMVFDDLLTSYKSLPMTTRQAYSTEWMAKFGKGATPITSLLMGDDQGGGQPHGQGHG